MSMSLLSTWLLRHLCSRHCHRRGNKGRSAANHNGIVRDQSHGLCSILSTQNLCHVWPLQKASYFRPLSRFPLIAICSRSFEDIHRQHKEYIQDYVPSRLNLITIPTMSQNSTSRVQDIEDFGITRGGSTATAAKGACQSCDNCPKRIQGARPPPRGNTSGNGKAPVDNYGRRGAIDMGRPYKKS